MRSLEPPLVLSPLTACTRMCVGAVRESVCRLRVLAELLGRSVLMPKIDRETGCFEVTTRLNLLREVLVKSLLVCIYLVNTAFEPHTLDST